MILYPPKKGFLINHVNFNSKKFLNILSNL